MIHELAYQASRSAMMGVFGFLAQMKGLQQAL